MIDTQLSTGYESSSGLRDAFSRIMGVAPTKQGQNNILIASWLDTKLGPMIAIGSETELYLLEFVDRRGLEREVENLRKKTKSVILLGATKPLLSIKEELNAYFNGQLNAFHTPICLLGSPFQKQVWDALQKIPSGETCSYADIARRIGRPTAFRAVAQANGANQLAIIIPCHRVINNNGDLGGYSGGIIRKQWLINHEKTGLCARL